MPAADDLLSVDVVDGDLVAIGEVDAHSAPLLASAISASGSRVRLDLSGVVFMDSSGLCVVIDAHQQLERCGGRLTLLNPSRVVRRILEISGTDRHLSIEG